MKTILKYTSIVVALVLSNIAFAQNYIPYYPANWEFKNDVDLVDVSQVKSVIAEGFVIDGNEQIPFSTTSWNWNSTHQLTYYSFTNQQMKESSFDVQINYVNPNGNQLKSVKILNSNTRKTVEERYYTNGSFDIEKINVKHYLENIAEPNVFDVKYEGNDNDFTQETVYITQNKIKSQAKYWQKNNDNGSYQLVKKLYIDKLLDQTDSIIFNSDRKKVAHYTVNLGTTTKTLYNYKPRKVEVFGEEYDYQQLERIVKDGKDTERYEYEYDAKGNWIVRKTYRIKFARWEYYQLTKREIEYR